MCYVNITTFRDAVPVNPRDGLILLCSVKGVLETHVPFFKSVMTVVMLLYGTSIYITGRQRHRHGPFSVSLTKRLPSLPAITIPSPQTTTPPVGGVQPLSHLQLVAQLVGELGHDVVHPDVLLFL